MSTKTRAASLLAAMTLAVAGQAQASLLLDTAVTSQFNGNTTTTNTVGNDLPNPRPATLYFGQLKATANGFVDFFYVGNEAAYTNTFNWGNNQSYSTAGKPDVFTSPHNLIGTLDVLANTFLDFGFCTNGGDSVNNAGRCALNDNSNSLRRQFNYSNNIGYRSIAFSSLSAYDPNNGNRVFNGNPGTSNLWMAFWDDSGAKNDDNHDDMIIGMRFRPIVSVPEPATLAVFTLGLLGAAFALRRRMGLVTKR
jgi:PEP-CTERM motif